MVASLDADGQLVNESIYIMEPSSFASCLSTDNHGQTSRPDKSRCRIFSLAIYGGGDGGSPPKHIGAVKRV
jgi:hypothetical protein